MPDRSDKYLGYEEREAEDDTLYFLSKSRIRDYAKNPEHFRLKHLEGYGSSTTAAMDRGTRIHETIEEYYKKAPGEVPVCIDDPAVLLPEDRSMWADFIEPYLSNFFEWENRRLEYARNAVGDEDAVREWLPVGIEIEHWRHDDLFPLPLEGTVDVVLNASAVPGVDTDDGVVIVDFKTGKVPKKQYRDEGIHIELAFYALLLSDEYNVTATAAYYPRSNETIAYYPDEDSVEWILSLVNDCAFRVEDYDGGHFETNEGPLCKWGLSDDEESEFYGICPCSWGVPANNKESFEMLVEKGLSSYQIADKMDTTPNAVNYWKYKLSL